MSILELTDDSLAVLLSFKFGPCVNVSHLERI